MSWYSNPWAVTIGGGLAVAASSAALKTGRRFWANLWARIRSKPIVFTETVRIVQDVNGSFWGEAKRGERRLVQIRFDGHVTDISGQPNRILRAEIPKPLTYGDLVLIADGHDGRRPQTLAPHESAEIHTSFFVEIEPPKQGHAWQSAVVFIDQYGNRHKLRKCVFRSLFPDTPLPPKEPEEFPYEIGDPVEKEIVSVLKAELSRYAICGRICGGLGSIHLVYQGREFTGVGNDSWPSNSPLNHVLVNDPQAAFLKSDNLDALVTFYQSFTTDDERSVFVTALLDRLDGQKGYLAVSYFIVAVLWRVGALAAALEKAKRNLPENDTRFFGLSNVLMLLNGVLKYRYPDFTNPMLDDIERLSHGLREHTFLIPAKLAAIRASRLRGRQMTN